MKKIICIFMCLSFVFLMLTGCNSNSNKESNSATPDTAQISKKNDTDEGTMYFSLGTDTNAKLKIVIPPSISDYCYPKYASYFEEGWINFTICALDENCDLFTIYVSSNDSFKEFEKENNYKILCTDGIYTVVWYEHKLSENLTPEVKLAVDEIKLNYKAIQESAVIQIFENN